MGGNSKICIGIQSQLILPEFINLMLSLYKEGPTSSKRQHTRILRAKKSVISFQLTSIFSYIFCNFDTVELQKMYGKIKVF